MSNKKLCIVSTVSKSFQLPGENASLFICRDSSELRRQKWSMCNKRRVKTSGFCSSKAVCCMHKMIFIILSRLKFDSFCRCYNFLARKLQNCIYHFYNIIDLSRVIRDQGSREGNSEHRKIYQHSLCNITQHWVYPSTSLVISALIMREKKSWGTKKDITNKYICQDRAPLENGVIVNDWSCCIRTQIILKHTGGYILGLR